ncbi:class I SAM-dependent methyltransferase [uncultured Methanolobus sp.]|uniref:class I SAM-dependent methyltransferase n=1 Tax=uncultured Methanolobus sp. TaxID=218300 RepID=UPI002AAA859F|nr:class I SAM-dependent methyltransferase [uncultured Methanolobus sp.]
MDEEMYIKALESTGRLSEPAIRNAIKSLKLPEGSRILDVPCGTGKHMQWMLEEYSKVNITGVDIAEAHLEYTKNRLLQAGKIESCEFVKGDMNKLDLADNTFDLTWCCDGLWPGPKEMGCPAEEPYEILDNMVRMTRKGGTIAILFWSSQKLLPGYSFLEASLNATSSATMPANEESKPELHFMCAPAWMRKSGLENIQVRTFAADILAPLDEQEKEGITMLFDMFWAEAEQEVSEKLWEQYKKIRNPESDEYILNNEDYTGLITYTMFTGEVSK